jgi:hypothetical protein
MGRQQRDDSRSQFRLAGAGRIQESSPFAGGFGQGLME